ncbi:hypothetical protein [Streptomyces sp. NPDC014746]|uniref:hypothetical protein n=1 Tax=Streptomyces sp. NPDC014746 TaxID=3364904 RepID=UPI0036F60A01
MPKSYCSDRCRKAAKRAIDKALKTSGGNPGHLGTETTEFRAPSDLRRSGPRRNGNPGHTDAAGERERAAVLSQDGPQTDDDGGTPAELARKAVAKARKARRYQGRRTLWSITGDPACKGCGRDLMDPDTGLLFAQTATGASVVLGLMRCARIWFCPVCSATIRHARAEEITRAVIEWIRRGGTCYFVTLAARHDYEDELADLMDAIQGTRSASKAEIEAVRAEVAAAQGLLAATQDDTREAVNAARLAAPKGQKKAAMNRARAEKAGGLTAAHKRLTAAKQARATTARRAGAYQRLITGGVWAGDARKESAEAHEGIRGRIGYVGMIRSTEVTVGLVNLWHPHIHAIVFVGGVTEGERSEKRIVDTFTPTDSDLEAWEDHWRATWTSHLQKVNPKYRPSDTCSIPDCKCDGKGHGVDFERIKTVADAKKMGEYIAKTQDGKSPALELARGDLKQGRKGNMTPFEVLYRIGDLLGGVPEDEAPGHGSLGWCLDRWHEYERAMTGRRAIEWTRYLRQMLGITGGDTEDDDKDLLLGADADAGEFRGGAAVTEDGWTAVLGRALDLAATEAAEGTDANTDPEAVARRLSAVLDAAGAPAGSVRALTTAELADAYAAQKENLARRREEAAARRRRENERDRTPDPGAVNLRHATRDRRTTENRARRHLDRRAKTAQE